MHIPARTTFKAAEAGTYLGIFDVLVRACTWVCSVCLICFIHKFDEIKGCSEA